MNFPRLAQFPEGRAVRVLAALATLGMLALFAWLAASAFWSLTTPTTSAPVVPIETDPIRAAQAVAGHHLFGEAPVQKAAVARASPPADIKLRGVIAASRPGQPAVAVLSIGGKSPISVREGEEAVPGLVVHRVLAREVQLKSDGEIQSVTLPDRLASPVPAVPAKPVPERGRQPAGKSS